MKEEPAQIVPLLAVIVGVGFTVISLTIGAEAHPPEIFVEIAFCGFGVGLREGFDVGPDVLVILLPNERETPL